MSYLRRNFWVNTMDVSFFQFGISLVAVTTVLPAFALSLGASNTLIAFIPGVLQMGWLLPQFFLAYFIVGLKSNLNYLLKISFFQRIPWLLIALCCFLVGDSNPKLLLTVFFLLYALAALFGGAAGPAWGELIARVIPMPIRGKFFGYTNLFGNGLAILGGLFVKWVMENDRIAFPDNYGILFLGAGVILFASYFFLSLNREPFIETEKIGIGFFEFLKSIPGLLRERKDFIFVIIARILGQGQFIGIGFFTPFALKKFNLTDEYTGHFVLASAIATMIYSPLAGRIGDKLGHHINFLFSRIYYLASVLFLVFGENIWFIYLAFSFMAMAMASLMICHAVCGFRGSFR